MKFGVGVHHFRNYNCYVGFQISGSNLCNLVEHFVTSVDGIALTCGCTLTRARTLFVSTGSSLSYNPAKAKGASFTDRLMGAYVFGLMGGCLGG